MPAKILVSYLIKFSIFIYIKYLNMVYLRKIIKFDLHFLLIEQIYCLVFFFLPELSDAVIILFWG